MHFYIYCLFCSLYFPSVIIELIIFYNPATNHTSKLNNCSKDSYGLFLVLIYWPLGLFLNRQLLLQQLPYEYKHMYTGHISLLSYSIMLQIFYQ